MKPIALMTIGLTVLALLAGTVPARAQAGEALWGFAINSRGDFRDDEMIDALWRVNLATGETEYVGHTGFGFLSIDAIAMDPEGRLFGADDVTKSLLRIGLGSGLATPISNNRGNTKLPVGTPLDFGMTFTCDGDLLLSSAATGNLYQADPETGEVELLGSLDAPIVDMATIGREVFGIGRGSDADGNAMAPELFRIDVDTPQATLIGPLGDQVEPYNQAGLAADEHGHLYAIANRRNLGRDGHAFIEGAILSIDPDTGQAERIADTLVGFESLAIAPPTACSFQRGQTGPAAVPVMSPVGLVALIGLLCGLAALRIRG